MKSADEKPRPWVARSLVIVAIAWVAGYFLTGSVEGATAIAGVLILVALAGLLYT